jgi:hypothetical protein
VFIELMPLLAGRTVMITVVREDEKMLRVNVIPKKVKEDENPALTTPLSYTALDVVCQVLAQFRVEFLRSSAFSRHFCSGVASGWSSAGAGVDAPGPSKREDHRETLRPLGACPPSPVRGRREAGMATGSGHL